MAAVYDSIAKQYKNTFELPFRKHIEEFTYFQVLGDLSGKSILDLACGEGRYTRKFKQKGAAHVVGVDISGKMIELARQKETEKLLGIEYIIRDVLDLGKIGNFDLVVASFLLNYSRTKEELLEMCQNIYSNLKPGGRFITINNNPELSPSSYSKLKKYGYTKKIPEPFTEGAPITIIFTTAEGQVRFDNYYISKATYELAFQHAGFKEIHWHSLIVSSKGIQEFGHEYWQDFLDYAPDVVIECIK